MTGKVGTDGQTKVKDCGTGEKAISEAEKLVKAKSKGGYVTEGAVADAGVDCGGGLLTLGWEGLLLTGFKSARRKGGHGNVVSLV